MREYRKKCVFCGNTFTTLKNFKKTEIEKCICGKCSSFKSKKLVE